MTCNNYEWFFCLDGIHLINYQEMVHPSFKKKRQNSCESMKITRPYKSRRLENLKKHQKEGAK